MNTKEKLPKITLKEVLLEEFLVPQLAKEMGYDPDELAKDLEEVPLYIETARALSDHFGNSKEFWINLSKES